LPRGAPASSETADARGAVVALGSDAFGAGAGASTSPGSGSGAAAGVAALAEHPAAPSANSVRDRAAASSIVMVALVEEARASAPRRAAGYTPAHLGDDTESAPFRIAPERAVRRAPRPAAPP
jgi:hypothetical protein